MNLHFGEAIATRKRHVLREEISLDRRRKRRLSGDARRQRKDEENAWENGARHAHMVTASQDV
jgi:hypothetical protein